VQQEVFIHNSRMTITLFYVGKLMFAFEAGLTLAICHYEYIDGNLIWMLFALLSVLLLYISDAIAMVIGRNGMHLTFHHLWRQSSLDITEARFLPIRSQGNWLRGGSSIVMLVAMGRWPWQLHLVGCDQKNNLSGMLDIY
jgi:hypothetical protein